jgi:hypothetical protein
MSVIYVQTTGTQTVGFGTSPTPIPGLSLTVPEGFGEQAFVTLNVPNPYSYTESTQYVAGGWFGLSVDGTTLPNVASFTFVRPSFQNVENLGRTPVTLVVAVALAAKPQTIVALWRSYGMWLRLDTPASLSAIIA